MARKRLNKNIVASLTGAGIFLSVLVVAVAAYQGSRRDPEVLAKKAEARHEAGDYKRAVSLYSRAFRVNNEAKYLIEAARIAYGAGEVRQAVSLLGQAYSQQPNDPQVLRALLDRYWEFRQYSASEWQWEQVLEYAGKLVEMNQEDVAALAAKSQALWMLRLRDPENIPSAEQDLQRAVELEPTDPRVAFVHASRSLSRAGEAARDLLEKRPGDLDGAKALVMEARESAVEILTQALAAHTDEIDLRTLLAQVLFNLDRIDECKQTLDAGIEVTPDDADLHFVLARFYSDRARKVEEAADDTEALVSFARAGIASAEEALRLAPGLFDAYSLRADLYQLAWQGEGRWEGSEKAALQARILVSYQAGFQETVDLKTARAVLGTGARAQAIIRAFDTAILFVADAPDDAARNKALEHARQFVAEAQARYPEDIIVPLMEGQLALNESDPVRAIQAFTRADEKAGATGSLYAAKAREQLARLHLDEKNFGLSQKYTDGAIEIYEKRGGRPPLWLWVNKAHLYNATNEPQRALDLLDLVQSNYGNDPRLMSLRARSLALLGRTDESISAFQKLEDVDSQVSQGRLYLSQQRYADAEEVLRKVLEADPHDLRALNLLVQVFMLGSGKNEAVAYVDELLAGIAGAKLRRPIEAVRVRLTAADTSERAAQLLELINQIEDPAERENELSRFWLARANGAVAEEGETPQAFQDRVQTAYEEADKHLVELDSLEGFDEDRLRTRFEIALRLGKVKIAEAFLPRLAEHDVDRAGGAMLRGQLEMVQRRPAEALREYRDAEQALPSDTKLKLMIAEALLGFPEPRLEDAVEVLKQVVSFDPRNFEGHRRVFICYENLGLAQDALAHLEDAARLDPQNAFVQERKLLLDEQRDPRIGIVAREEKREVAPWDVQNLIKLAALYDRVSEFDRVDECVQAALEQEPEHRGIAQFALKYYAQRDDRKAGEAALETYIDARGALRDGAEIGARTLLGRFYDELGAQDDSLSTYEQAVQQADALEGVSPDRKLRVRLGATVELAGFFGRRGRFPELIETYDRALAMIDETGAEDLKSMRREIVVRQLQATLSNEQYGDFEQKLADFRKESPFDLRVLKIEAEWLLRTQPERSYQTLSEVLAQSPEDVWALYMRGKLNVRLRRYNEAHEDLVALKRVAPRAYDYRPRLQLAELYTLTNQSHLAESELRDLMRILPDDRYVAVQLLETLRLSEQAEKAQAFVNEMIAKDPGQPFWYYRLGRFLIERDEYTAAVRPLQKAVELTRNVSPQAERLAINDWVLALTRGNQPEEALRVFEDLVAERPEMVGAQLRVYIAEACLALDRSKRAHALLRKAVDDTARESMPGLIFVADRAVELFSPEDFAAMLREALEVAEDNLPVRLRLRSALARTLLQFGGPEARSEVSQLVEQTLAEAPEGAVVKREAQIVKARLLEFDGKHEGAVKVYEEILASRPDHPQVLNNLAFILAENLGRSNEALAYAERAKTLLPGDANILDTVGWVYFKNERYAQAEAELREAMRLSPDNADATYHLGRVLVIGRRTAEARRTFERARELARKADNRELLRQIADALNGLN